jgi:hypothetical protein
MVTTVPPVIGPDDGEIPVTVGGGGSADTGTAKRQRMRMAVREKRRHNPCVSRCAGTDLRIRWILVQRVISSFKKSPDPENPIEPGSILPLSAIIPYFTSSIPKSHGYINTNMPTCFAMQKEFL